MAYYLGKLDSMRPIEENNLSLNQRFSISPPSTPSPCITPARALSPLPPIMSTQSNRSESQVKCVS